MKEFVGVNIVKTEERLVDDNTWSVTLVEEPKLRISAYCCSKPKNSENICGDSFIFTDLENGRYLLALADGMGSGKGLEWKVQQPLKCMKILHRLDF